MRSGLSLRFIDLPKIGSIAYQSNALRAETRRNQGIVSIVVADETG